MLNFRMFASVKFNREIDEENDIISVGGYEMTMGGTSVHFDFEDYTALIDENDPCKRKLSIESERPDFDCFEELYNVTEDMLRNVSSIDEFFIYIDRENDDGNTLKPISLVDLYFEVEHDGEFTNIEIPKSVRDEAIFATDSF